ncbi:MAG: diaminopimelate decarboxylase [Chloroherpetonaceae bacterium]|nr:diaminopimelate decarboxylase [Chloroherpetonaceae bacterium]
MPLDDFFRYKNGSLFVENVSIEKLAKSHATPLFVTSKSAILHQYDQFEKAFDELPHLTCYSVKANYTIGVIRVLLEAGSGLDVNSGGELARALKAGASPSKIIMAGVGKTVDEIEFALEAGILLLKAESISEIQLIDKVAKRLKKRAPLALRITPNITAETHPYITTGNSDKKFGIDEAIADESLRIAKKLKNIDIIGLEMHIGSQIFDPEAYHDATLKLLGVKSLAESMGYSIRYIDIGGGFPVTYTSEKPATPIREFSKVLSPLLKNAGAAILFEPGRYLVANASVLVTKVLYRKSNHKKKQFIIVDAAMSELIRPALYGSHHDIVEVKKSGKKEIADIVGPVCESGDFFAKERQIGAVKEGEFLAILSAGAYGLVMASNYNARLKPAEVLVSGKSQTMIRKRETLEQHLQNE